MGNPPGIVPDAPLGGTLGIGLGVGLGVAAVHVATLMMSVVVDTVPPNASACPVHVTVLPIVMPEPSMSVPTNVELAPSVVAAVGVQKTSQADAPRARTAELDTVVRAPLTRKTMFRCR